MRSSKPSNREQTQLLNNNDFSQSVSVYVCLSVRLHDLMKAIHFSFLVKIFTTIYNMQITNAKHIINASKIVTADAKLLEG